MSSCHLFCYCCCCECVCALSDVRSITQIWIRNGTHLHPLQSVLRVLCSHNTSKAPPTLSPDGLLVLKPHINLTGKKLSSSVQDRRISAFHYTTLWSLVVLWVSQSTHGDFWNNILGSQQSWQIINNHFRIELWLLNQYWIKSSSE